MEKLSLRGFHAFLFISAIYIIMESAFAVCTVWSTAVWETAKAGSDLKPVCPKLYPFSTAWLKKLHSLLSNLHPPSRAEGFHFPYPFLFKQNCTYPPLQTSAQQLNELTVTEISQHLHSPMAAACLPLLPFCNHPVHESSNYSLVSGAILSFVPVYARKDIQPLQSNMVLQGNQMRRKGTGDMTDASPVGVTTAATADNKVTAHQQKLSSPILSPEISSAG